jgi:AraC family transcriptional regulator
VADVFVRVPANHDDCLREVAVAGFLFTESRHAPGLLIPPHAHERATITVLLRGTFDEGYRARRESCRDGSVLLRPSGECHSDCFGSAGGYNLVIELEPALCDSLRPCGGVLDSISQTRDPRLAVLGWKIHHQLCAPDTAAALSLESLSLEFLAIASRRRLGPWPSAFAPRWLRQVRDAISDSFMSGVRMVDLAHTAGVHPVYLARAFRACFGCSPGSYLRSRRLGWAVEQIATTARPLSDIAHAAGFSDQSHLTRFFTQTFGVPPRKYRTRAHTP